MVSELRKILYARTYRYLALGAIGLSALSCVASAYAVHTTAISQAGLQMSGLDDADVVSGMYAKSVAAYIIVVVIGVIMMASEFRNGTAVATFLAAPRRVSVLIAKLAVSVLVGITVMSVAMALGIAACAVTLRQFPEAVAPAPGTFGRLAVIAVVSGAVLAIIGVSLGTLIRNQAVATTISIVWLQIVDSLIVLLWPAGGRWLPSGLIAGMMSLDITAREQGTSFGLDTSNYLQPVPATLVLLVYGVAFAGLAVATSLRRDVD